MKSDKAEMVGWYDPGQLLDTARKTVISTIIGENADQRLTNASLTNQLVFDYSIQIAATDYSFKEIPNSVRDELWIDYVADVGDGWDSTHTVAHRLAAGSMPPTVEGGKPRRGEVLILGGDEVYPTGSIPEYQTRLIEPYTLAAKSAGFSGVQPVAGTQIDLKEKPHVFAIPGNHDWYDSLNAFRYIFCAPYFMKRIFAGGWRTMQRRSYFALKLPQNWWLFGIDLQLTHKIDWAQLEYFKSIIQNRTNEKGEKFVTGPDFEPGSNVIICSPEPLWIEEEKSERVRGSTPCDSDKLNLVYLEQMIEDAHSRVRLFLAGDSHHYRRFASTDDQVQKITAGGGGAFLHPTHDINFNSLTDSKGRVFTHRESYPDVKVSRRLGFRNLSFVGLNRRFGIVTAALYCLVVWLAHNTVHVDQPLSLKLISDTGVDLIDQPLLVIAIAILVFGLIFFTDTRSKIQKYLGGSLHAAAHLFACLLLGWGGIQFFHRLVPYSEAWWYAWLQWILIGLFVAVGGWIIGSVIMGLYLLISLQVFGRHANEAFSSLKIADYKNFLRIHISKAGLEIYPLKIEKVSRRVESTKVELIEEPILLSN